jgi:hypothetical protein
MIVGVLRLRDMPRMELRATLRRVGGWQVQSHQVEFLGIVPGQRHDHGIYDTVPFTDHKVKDDLL